MTEEGTGEVLLPILFYLGYYSYSSAVRLLTGHFYILTLERPGFGECFGGLVDQYQLSLMFNVWAKMFEATYY